MAEKTRFYFGAFVLILTSFLFILGCGTESVTEAGYSGVEEGEVTEQILGKSGSEACKLGFWKANKHLWPVSVVPDQPVSDHFLGATLYGLAHDTIDEALNYGYSRDLTGSAKLLIKEGIVSLLNSLTTDYPLTNAEVKTDVSLALQTEDRRIILELYKELTLLNRAGDCPF